MGTTGSGQFGNYKSTDIDKCDKEINTELEEVASSEYYKAVKDVPKPKTPVSLLDKPEKGRFIVQETKSGRDIGLLPTKFNYLLVCIGKGYSYEGEVLSSQNGKVPRVKVKLGPA